MGKTSTSATKYEWAGVDLHVHTPASKDYIGPADDAEYVALIKRANEFEDREHKVARPRRSSAPRPIRCIAFTDHNSVEGFRKWRSIYDETVRLAEAVRDRDPNNSLLQRLDSDLTTLRAVRVLMGFELKAYPGVHLLFIFHESVTPELAATFLSEVYKQPYESIAGLPDPTTVLPVEEVLNHALAAFDDQFFVVAPHIESGGGVYEALKELHPVRMGVFVHPALRALSFNKEETRERVRSLLCQPDYARDTPLSFIQSSDAHGSRGTVGQPRTEVHVPNGRATFSSIREALLHANRVKCSVDFADEEYRRITEDEAIARFVGREDAVRFREEDEDQIARFACAALNSGRGIIELDANIRSEDELREAYPERIRTELESILERLLEPRPPILLTKALSFSATRIRILFKPITVSRLYSMAGAVLVLDDDKARPAHSFEIESLVAERINARFGGRYRRTLEHVAEDSVLLSKLPRGIPLFLRCREHLDFFTPKDLRVQRIDGVSTKGRELSDEAEHLYDEITDDTPFGLSKGNTTLIWPKGEVRDKEHYIRFLAFRAELRQEAADKYATADLQESSIVVSSGGASHICNQGPLITQNPVMEVKMPDEWARHRLACLAWLKSSFFVWYCAVHLSDKNPYQHLHAPNSSVRLPFPKISHDEFYRRLGSLAQNVVIEEKRFLDELQKELRRGAANSSLRDKLRNRHNHSLNAICLSIDDEVWGMLGLSESEAEFIAKTLRDMGLTDFGFLERRQAQQKAEEEREKQ